ncbi:MAG TPA: MlaD family protein [Verrucomicrobiae bacterium]|nr:MlaD family protein [Verrucomicrobiae bacterium]
MALQDLTPQLRTRLRRVERIVGLFVGVATLLLIAGFAYYLYHTAQRKGWFTPKCPCYTYVGSAQGLTVGGPVMLLGFSIGEITTITAQPAGSWEKVFIGFEVKSPYYGYIYTDTQVKIAAASFLGGRQLELTARYAGEPVVFEKNGRVAEILYSGKRLALADAPKGAFIPADEEPALTERAEKLVAQVEAALPNILALTNQLNLVLTNTAALTANANALVAEARPAVTNLAARLDSVLVSADTNLTMVASDLDQTLINLAAITSNLNAQVQSNDQILGSISKLVVDADNLVQGLKQHWLLRGIFQKMNSQTNAPPAKR